MTKEKLKEELIKVIPYVKAENEATDNWHKAMFTAWYNRLITLATEYGGKAVFELADPNDWFSDVKYIGVDDIMVEVV